MTTVVILVVAMTSCGEQINQERQTGESKADLRPEVDLTAAFLENMPMNSEKQCFGISTVVEALLDGKPEGDEPQSPTSLAERVFESLVSDSQISYGRHVWIENKPVPVHSAQALELLSRLVADLHKQLSVELTLSVESEEQYRRSFFRTREELDARLNADPDKTVAFCGVGFRLFPDGTERESDHAFLIRRQSTGEAIVYDSNAPGTPIDCRLLETDESLEVEWKCEYQDTGLTTIQIYTIIDATSFSRLVSSSKPGGDECVAEQGN